MLEYAWGVQDKRRDDRWDIPSDPQQQRVNYSAVAFWRKRHFCFVMLPRNMQASHMELFERECPSTINPNRRRRRRRRHPCFTSTSLEAPALVPI